jgi:putative tryptophan/tyrosine transport system substrate-binding protein
VQVNSRELIGKRLELLWEAVPDLHRVACLRGVGFDGPRFDIPRNATEAVASKRGIRVRYFEFQNAQDLARVFEEMAKERDQALLVWSNPLLNRQRQKIFELTMKYRLPAIYNVFSGGVPGEFLVYAATNDELVREGALDVQKIFKGANPGDLPIGKPTKVKLVINLKTANALGLTLPQSLLLYADEVIE